MSAESPPFYLDATGRVHTRVRWYFGPSPKLKRLWFLAIRDGGRCHYCRCSLDDITVTEDHVVPRIAGGHSRLTNIVLACRRCNSSKGPRPYEDYAP